jgi:hypothetical protein
MNQIRIILLLLIALIFLCCNNKIQYTNVSKLKGDVINFPEIGNAGSRELEARNFLPPTSNF